jgi:SPW repeat
LLASPWVLEFPPAAVWNLWVCGYAMLTVTAAALTAEADWEPHSNFCLGIWVAMAPWTLGFSQDAPAVFVHVLGGQRDLVAICGEGVDGGTQSALAF